MPIVLSLVCHGLVSILVAWALTVDEEDATPDPPADDERVTEMVLVDDSPELPVAPDDATPTEAVDRATRTLPDDVVALLVDPAPPPEPVVPELAPEPPTEEEPAPEETAEEPTPPEMPDMAMPSVAQPESNDERSLEARFLADRDNRVAEETRARDTSLNAPAPTPEIASGEEEARVTEALASDAPDPEPEPAADDEAVEDEPADDQPAEDEPAEDEPADEEPVADEVAAEEMAAPEEAQPEEVQPQEALPDEVPPEEMLLARADRAEPTPEDEAPAPAEAPPDAPTDPSPPSLPSEASTPSPADLPEDEAGEPTEPEAPSETPPQEAAAEAPATPPTAEAPTPERPSEGLRGVTVAGAFDRAIEATERSPEGTSVARVGTVDPEVYAEVLGARDRRDRERVRQQERGSTLGGDVQGRWERTRAAMENFDVNVTTATETHLNTASSPFAGYIHMLHNRIHPIWSRYLFWLDVSYGPGSDLADPNLVVTLEYVILGDGTVAQVRIVRSSGQGLFDGEAVNMLWEIGPHEPPPSAMLSSDGRAYIHWSFHRDQRMCGTFGATVRFLSGDR